MNTPAMHNKKSRAAADHPGRVAPPTVRKEGYRHYSTCGLHAQQEAPHGRHTSGNATPHQDTQTQKSPSSDGLSNDTVRNSRPLPQNWQYSPY